MRLLVNLIGGGIGNNILTIPLLKNLNRWGNFQIDLLVSKGKENIFSNEKYIHKIYVYERKKNLFRNILLLTKLRLKRYDYSIVPLPKSGFVTLINYYIGSKKRFAHDIQKFNFLYTDLVKYTYRHDVFENVKFCDLFNINRSKLIFDTSFKIPESALIFASNYSLSKKRRRRRIIGIHPGSEGIYKRWGVENFYNLTKRLLKHHIVFYFLGPSELDLSISLSDENFQVIRNLDLLKSAAIIKQCDLFLSNDSGMMHLASALGVSTIGLFGPTNPRYVAPFGDNCFVISKEINCNLNKDRICKKVLKNKFTCPLLKEITVNEVYNKIQSVLK